LALEIPLAQTGALRQRLEKDLEQLEKNITNYLRQLADETATSKKPANVVEGMRQKLAEYQAQLAKIKSALDGLNAS
jgi:valyl-tRNA synthetase